LNSKTSGILKRLLLLKIKWIPQKGVKMKVKSKMLILLLAVRQKEIGSGNIKADKVKLFSFIYGLSV
jgi:hypothetical protein